MNTGTFSHRPILKLVAVAAVLAAPLCLAQPGTPKPAPTYANVSYAAPAHDVLDFWKAASAKPTPLVLYIHGGGFRGGSKDGINAQTLRALLDAGISVAAIDYRFIQEAKLPAAFHDCRRALQFLRWRAPQWNIDKTRVGAFGGSAGAEICMYLAFHDDMAKPSSPDPVERESTRLQCVATIGGQITLDLDWWVKWIPGYEKPPRDRTEVVGNRPESEIRAALRDVGALYLVSPDDPPIYMRYGMAPGDPVPKDPKKARGWKMHHVIFGVKLKEKLDAAGVENYLVYPGVQVKYASPADFLIDKLKGR